MVQASGEQARKIAIRQDEVMYSKRETARLICIVRRSEQESHTDQKVKQLSLVQCEWCVCHFVVLVAYDICGVVVECAVCKGVVLVCFCGGGA